MGQILDWVFSLWPDRFHWLIVPWAWGALIIGTSLVVLTGTAAVSHFGLGVPIVNRGSGEPATTTPLIFTTIALGGGGAFFAALGLLILRWKTG